MAHYTKMELELYRHGQMSVLGRIACSTHLKACPECARLLAELEADDQLLAKIRQSIREFQELSAK